MGTRGQRTTATEITSRPTHFNHPVDHLFHLSFLSALFLISTDRCFWTQVHIVSKLFPPVRTGNHVTRVS